MCNKEKYDELNQKYENLCEEHKRLQDKITFVQKISTSFGLAKRISEYQEKASSNNISPHPETGNLLAALANRAFIGTILSVLLSIGTIIIIGSQTYVFLKQKEILQGQQIQASLSYYMKATKDDEDKLYKIECTSDDSGKKHGLFTLLAYKKGNDNLFRARLALSIDPRWRGGKHINDQPDHEYSEQYVKKGKRYERRFKGNRFQIVYALNLLWMDSIFKERKCNTPKHEAARLYTRYYWNNVMVTKLSYVLSSASEGSVFRSQKGYPEYNDILLE